MIMQKLTFADKKASQTFSDNSYNFPHQKPMLCPICGAYQDGTIVSRAIHPGPLDTQIGTIGYRCTHCTQNYLVLYKIDRAQKKIDFAGFYPAASAQYENQILDSVSSRFISSYNQALRAEIHGDIELAAIGYRQSLECLVKDYAIHELKIERSLVIKKSLFEAISEYLEEKDLISTADVVRILGNDYAHYERKYPQHDFELLKRYMEIFIKLVETKLLIRHPPVSRNP